MPWWLPAGNIGAVYSQPIQTVGGFGPLTFYILNVIPGTRGLPPGLNLDLTTGIVSGIPIGPAGTFDFTIAVQDGPGAANAVFGILIDPSGPPQITTSSLPTGTLSVLYNQPLQAAAGIGPLTWSISAGSLPPGLTFGPPSTGPRVIISGTPTTQGTFNFKVTVTDTVRQVDTRALSITISLPAPPTITTTTLPAGSIGQTYNQPVMATGTGPLTWSISAGALPPGLNLNATTGTITGSPTATGTFPFTVRVADTFGQNDTQPRSILVSTQ
jgi:hypothetical protein